MTTAERWVVLAEVTRPHGVRGEVRLRVYNADSDLLLDQRSVRLELPDGAARVQAVSSMRRADGAILAKLAGVDDRDAADALRGARVCVRRDAFPPLDDGEFYVCDVEGARVEGPDGVVGTVRDLASYPTVDALVVEGSKGRFEVPLLDSFVVVVDVGAGVVRITREALDLAFG